ncbi:GNAT family N-acetyltransferase [Namhaeicola litoreus]|uniref:GNAT family N-acetyltransferase n=1 Tax=Namhaeicola litoreus TaxID=1052145 RepID=A0ABW3Y3M0_9FLAO
MKKWLNNIQLRGNLIELFPLTINHKEALLLAASDGELWNLWYTSVPSKETIDAYILQALAQKEENIGYPFVVFHKETGKIIGSTRFCNADQANRRLEIGFTWYAKSHQRTGVNSECKFLLLRYAFEELNCIAVQFLTNWYNIQSREAITRLGAKQDGILRNHRINPDGTYRDSVVFSITEQEWPNVKKSLQLRLQRN